ncbi:mitochondrial coenzyme A diphosphatase NUDT8 [Episyrphus balteatus]|uniref:mitochondrial coenzyme A diphosphatase NUDT8 n=1 Tax=Episyrphus balteatus TaxID=286459 RepID=UPI0024853DF6|nr:mitochondrial coenzyme A diphosphatase NUDT8 [Episyrphus balteatus]
MILQKQAIRLSSSYSAESILSPENRSKCLKCLQSVPMPKTKPNRLQPEASVLVPVCIDDKGETSILYTRRSGLLSRHVHQISFPGGIKDPEDASFEDCALRETEEEIGLPRSRVEIWGSGPMLKPPNAASIMPVYATIRNLNLNELKLNKVEVESAFTIPISELASPNNFRYTQFKQSYSGPVFIVGDKRIWGITGIMTHNFLQCLLPKEESSKRPIIKYIRPYRAK